MSQNNIIRVRAAVIVVAVIATFFVGVFLWYQGELEKPPSTNSNGNVNTVVEQLPEFGVAIETEHGTTELIADRDLSITSTILQPTFYFRLSGDEDLNNILISIGDKEDILNDTFIDGVSINENKITIKFPNLLFPTQYLVKFGKKNGEIKQYTFTLKLLDEFSYKSIADSPYWYLIQNSKNFGNWSIQNQQLLTAPLNRTKAEGYSSLPFLLRFGDDAQFEFDITPPETSSEIGFYFLEQKVTVVVGRLNNETHIIQDNSVVGRSSYSLSAGSTYKVIIQKINSKYILKIKGPTEDQFVTVIDYLSERTENVQYNTVGFVQWPNSGGSVKIDNFTASGDEGGGS